MSQPRIVVGVDGSMTARHALDWAAAECDRHGAELVIAHAGDAVPGPPPRPDTPTEFGRSLLAEAEVEVEVNGADCPVSTVIADEKPVQLLIRLSAQAELVVVGSHGLGRQASTLLGSVAFRVAAHARCPVVVVPQDWDEQANPARPVLVGIPASATARDPLHAAFAEAELRGVPVHAVRTWSRVDWTDELTNLIYATNRTFEARQQEYVDRVLEPVRALYPDVPVQTMLSGDRIENALRKAAEQASLLVLGSRYTAGHPHTRLGPITARLLRRMPCPVLVVGHTDSHVAPRATDSLRQPVGSDGGGTP
jgi:nucleotide-binding universal stress UspA family protein